MEDKSRTWQRNYTFAFGGEETICVKEKKKRCLTVARVRTRFIALTEFHESLFAFLMLPYLASGSVRTREKGRALTE